MDLGNDTALITGASCGIGEEFAIQLAGRGVNPVLVARRIDKLAELRTRLLAEQPGLEIDVIAADLAVAGSPAELASAVKDLGRCIAILVNDAGVGLHGQFADQEQEGNAAHIQLICGNAGRPDGLLPATDGGQWPPIPTAVLAQGRLNHSGLPARSTWTSRPEASS